jgi:serine protease SohB
VNLGKVATGEYWYGQDALDLGLVDEIRTSDDYLLSQSDTNQIIKVSFAKKQKLADKLSGILGRAASSALLKVYEDLERKTLL